MATEPPSTRQRRTKTDPSLSQWVGPVAPQWMARTNCARMANPLGKCPATRWRQTDSAPQAPCPRPRLRHPFRLQPFRQQQLFPLPLFQQRQPSPPQLFPERPCPLTAPPSPADVVWLFVQTFLLESAEIGHHARTQKSGPILSESRKLLSQRSLPVECSRLIETNLK